MNKFVKIGIVILVITGAVYVGLPLFNSFEIYFNNEYYFNLQLENAKKLSCSDLKLTIDRAGYPPSSAALPGIEKRILDLYESKCGTYIPPNGRTDSPRVFANTWSAEYGNDLISVEVIIVIGVLGLYLIDLREKYRKNKFEKT